MAKYIWFYVRATRQQAVRLLNSSSENNYNNYGFILWGARELMKHRVFTAASLCSWWVLHWVGPHCTSSLSTLCLPDFLDSEALLKYAVYIYIYSI